METADPLGWTGEVIDGRYRVEHAVGEGGFGIVYRALHLKLQEPVALKFLKLGAEVSGPLRDRFLETFLEEGKILRRLSRSTSGIVQALDAGDAVSPRGIWSPYLVLEWLEGRSLADDLVQRAKNGNAPVALADAVALLGPAAGAVDVAHGQGIAHRDLKPENLFITNVGGVWTVKVVDFGVAKVMGDVAQLNAATAVTGIAPRAFSPAYAAPEQFEPVLGATGPWTDVYSLALVLLEVAAGRRAYSGDTAESFRSQAIDPERRPSFAASGLKVSAALERVMNRALAVDPRNRFPRAGLFWAELTQALTSEHVPARAASVTAPASVPVPRVPDLSPAGGATTSPVAVPPAHRAAPVRDMQTSGRTSRSARVLLSVGVALTLASGLVVLGLRGASKTPEIPPNMVLVPAGTYRLGSPSGNEKNCEGARSVEGKAFFIDRTEVTVRDYRRCQGAGACSSTREQAKRNAKWKGLELCNELRAEHVNVDDHPINCVDRDQAAAYCRFVQKRLPTDDEWERAARGPSGDEYPWGNDPPSCEVAVFQRGPAQAVRDRCPGVEGTAPVGSRLASRPFGVFDLAGNVWEWTSTTCPTAVAYGRQPDAATIGSATVPSAASPQEAELTRLVAKLQEHEVGMLRGGGHEWREENLRSWKRLPWPTDGAGISTGFRCASDVR